MVAATRLPSGVVFQARPFAARAALSLGDPRVAGFVAERIADEAIAQRRDLTGYRPLLVGTARAVVSSEAFRAGFQRTAEGAHALVFSQGAERVALSVPDIGVLVRSALAHDPALVARIPAKLRAGVTVGPSGRGARAVLKLAQLGHRFRRNAIVAIGSGSLLLFLGSAMPRHRQQALLKGGAALATAALVLFFLPPLGRTALTLSIHDPVLRPVVPGTLNVGHALPSVAQALIFITIVEVGPWALAAMIAASVFGAWSGAGIVSGWRRRHVQIGMGLALLVAAALMLRQLVAGAPGGADALALGGVRLALGLAGNFVLGALMSSASGSTRRA